MYIESVQLQNFRNYRELHLNFDKGTNIFYGDNAQGKTNILESVYLCGTTKSHRGSKDKEIIRFGEEESHIRMMIRKDELSYKIDMHLRKNKAKGVAINGLPIKKARELFGIVNLVFFSPEDLNIIKNGPGEFCIVWTFFSGICNDVSGRIPLPCLAAGALACTA